MRPAGITALSIFFVFGAAASGFAAASLLVPGGVLDPMWRVNPRGHEGLLQLGPAAVVLMLVVCTACVIAAVGLWKGRHFGWWTALGMLAANGTGDLINGLLMDSRTLIGVPIALALVAYLLTPRARTFFRVDAGHNA